MTSVQLVETVAPQHTEDAAKVRPYLSLLAQHRCSEQSSAASNVRTDGYLLQIGSQTVPVTANQSEFDNSWVCSPFNAIITYPLDELKNLPSKTLRAGLGTLIRSAGPLLKRCHINRVVCVNNWLLSTNLYPRLDLSLLQDATRLLCERFPRHAILFRSLNTVTNQPLLSELQKCGYLLAPSRQVYLYDGHDPAWLKRSNCRRDLKLLQQHPHLMVQEHEQLSDFCRVRELYDQLYLHKYSEHNPQYTNDVLQLWHQSRMLRMFGLSRPDGVLQAVVGTFTWNNVMTAPLVGYDTSRPQNHGLYRMLMAKVLQQTAAAPVMLNLSAGAASFKRLRGGQPELEYSAVYTSHLPQIQRRAWSGLAALLSNIGGPLLRRYQL